MEGPSGQQSSESESKKEESFQDNSARMTTHLSGIRKPPGKFYALF